MRRFGAFELDTRSGELWKAGVRIPLQEQPLKILTRLLEHPHQLVTRDELRRDLWPADTFVDFEHGLNAAIKRLRDALGDSAETPVFIETLPRHGYRFIGPTIGASTSAGDQRAVRSRRWLRNLALLIIAAASIAGAAWLTQGRRTPSPAPGRIQSIAVLPLANFTGNPADEYFVDGLTDQLSAALARASDLRVVSGSTSARYKSTTLSAAEIGKALGVDGLFEGAVMRSGGQLRVTVSLVDSRRDTRLWTETYDRSLGDILALYDEITAGVAREIRLVTDRGESARRRSRTVMPNAYDKFLQAIVFSRAWQAGGCTRAEPLLLEATARDPTPAEAFAELGNCYVYPDRLGRSEQEVGPKARKAIAHALELDDSLPEACVGLASVHHRLDFDWNAARHAVERALDLNPSSSAAHTVLGELLYTSGQVEEGLGHLREALRLDPLSLDHQVAFGFALRNTRRVNEAILQLQHTLVRDPTWHTARLWLAEAYGDAGRHDEAVSEYVRFLRDAALQPERAAMLTEELLAAYRRSGWRAFWMAELRIAEEEQPSAWRDPYLRYRGPYYMARRYARLHDRDQAIESLERSYVDRHHLMVFLDVEPTFDRLRADARFQDLRRRVGLRQR